jgi:hypothetical protein
MKKTEQPKAFGLDLAGYSTGSSALAMATTTDGGLTVAILGGRVFLQEIHGMQNLQAVCNAEGGYLHELLEEGPLFVDVPIDLQELLAPQNPTYVWQLTRRPVDQAFGGLRPLADKIGACVARMQNLWHRLGNQGGDPLGRRLFETYPAGSLKNDEKVHEKYKGKARYTQEKNGRWQPSREDNCQDGILARLLNDLGWTATQNGFVLTHDEFDAALCALTGVCDKLHGQELQAVMNEGLQQDGYQDGHAAPRGYTLLRHIPGKVVIHREH